MLDSESKPEPVDRATQMREASSFYGKGLHRAWQIQELVGKEMALTMLLTYAVEHKIPSTQDFAMEDIVADIRAIREILSEIQWTKRFDQFRVDFDLEDKAASPEAAEERNALGVRILDLTEKYMVDRNISRFIEDVTAIILSSKTGVGNKYIAAILQALIETYQPGYADMAIETLRKSRLPWPDYTISQMLSYFATAEDGPGFLRFLNFFTTTSAEDNGMRRWHWIKVPKQVTVPAPLDPKGVKSWAERVQTPAMITRLLETALLTRQGGYAGAYFYILVSAGYGITHRIIWCLMCYYQQTSDWRGARVFLTRVIEGRIPLHPDATKPASIQRIMMAILVAAHRQLHKPDVYQSLIELTTTYSIPPFEPNPSTKYPERWVEILHLWKTSFQKRHPHLRGKPTPMPKTINAQSFFKSLGSILGASPDAPGFVYFCEDADGNIIEAERSIWEIIKSSMVSTTRPSVADRPYQPATFQLPDQTKSISSQTSPTTEQNAVKAITEPHPPNNNKTPHPTQATPQPAKQQSPRPPPNPSRTQAQRKKTKTSSPFTPFSHRGKASNVPA